jgi:hypothetical protein
MSSRGLLTLLIAVVLLIVVGFVVSTSDSPERTTSELLLPQLSGKLNEIESITVTAAGDTTVATLRRGTEQWTVAEASNYPANLGRIRQNLIALADARIVEEKTSNPAFYDRLGVVDIGDEKATGTQLEIAAPEFTATLIVGDTGVSGGNMAYVRRSGEPQSLMVSADLDLSDDRAEWLDRDVMDISSAQVHRVIITHPDGGTLNLQKDSPDATDFTVAGIPEGRELSFGGVANSIGAVLSSLRLDEVAPGATFDAGAAEPVIARFETFNGMVVQARVFPVDAGVRVSFEVSADPALAVDGSDLREAAADAPSAEAEEAGDEALEGTEAADDAVDRFAAVQAEAEKLNQRLQGWIYTLPSYKTDQLTKRLEDLLDSDDS